MLESSRGRALRAPAPSQLPGEKACWSIASPTRRERKSPTSTARKSASVSSSRTASCGSRCSSRTKPSSTAMQEQFGLHELAVEDARNGHQRPKIEEYGQSLFVVLHTVELDGPQLHVGEVDIFVGANYVLSVRSRTRARVLRRPRPLRDRAGPAQTRLRVRAVRADGFGGGPLFPGARRVVRRAGAAGGRDLRWRPGSPQHRSALRSQAQAHDSQARGGAVVRGGGQAPRRPSTAGVRHAARTTSATSTTTSAA